MMNTSRPASGALRWLVPITLTLVALVVFACKIPVQTTPAPATASAELVAASGASVFIGAGDIGECATDGDDRTAHIVDSVLKADSVAKVDDAVFTLGDNAYPDGSASNFAICFAESWGDSAKRILKKIRPTPGNHEHYTDAAAPYYKYFGDKAGSPKKGYYSYDIGEWHALALNSEILVNPAFTLADRKEQEDWVRAELKKTPQKLCTVAYWHHPLYSSGWHGDNAAIRPIWQILQDGGVDLILAGHDHHYERFAPMNGFGTVDSVKGMYSYVVGTGGGDLRGVRNKPTPGSVTRIQGYFGVLKLTLGKGEFSSAFLDVNGRIWDPAKGKCHQDSVATPAKT